MSPRFDAIRSAAARKTVPETQGAGTQISSEDFGRHVFNRKVMQQMLPVQIYRHVIDAMDGKEKIKEEFSDSIAVAMKEWAIGHGATHFTHWFQPLTGSSAEKHDAFIEWISPDRLIERFTGKQLIQGEPDASSFPSGGLRSTYEARGYTGWDPTSPVFVWKEGNGRTLCIPSVFFSWTGDVLDSKIPLHRSERKLGDAALRLLSLTGIQASRVYTTIGLEQEYFVIDRALRDLRPDLLLSGRTVIGASSPKGQELQDHYFGAVKERILCYMHDFERAALKLGIPVKTRHNEVAPAQHEVAPVVERATRAIDHNILLMELMRKIALKHGLSCLLHEKPFEGINGSGKHCNWSLATDTGINLLDPSDTPGNSVHFLVLLTAFLHAVHEHALLLRASIGSATNDCRLGGHEAPPVIISVYLGDAIEHLLDNIEGQKFSENSSKKSKFDLGIKELPDLTKDYTDRNRTSPIAFTGAKFEFRALGSSANPAMAVTTLNAIVAKSLHRILDEIESSLRTKDIRSKKALEESVIPVLKRYLKQSKDIRFSGDNYSKQWFKEAKRRNLPHVEKSIDAFKALITPQAIDVFAGILTPLEMRSRYEIMAEHYAQMISIDSHLMIEIFKTQVLPAAMKQQDLMARSVQSLKNATNQGTPADEQISLLENYCQTIEKAISLCRQLETVQDRASPLSIVEKAEYISIHSLPVMQAFREVIDTIEAQVEDSLWPLPKYRELLFMI
ncbi:MAG: glutamine synthetase III [Waddliaceae bacterium]